MLEKLQSGFTNTFGLSNIKMDSFLRQHCSAYQGIFAPDTLPKKHISEGNIICNLSNSDSMGSHYITIIIGSSNVLYIDTFGTLSENDEINNFLLSLKKPIFFNNMMIQHLESSYCGFYAILFCMYFSEQQDFKIKFSNNLRENDLMCIEYIKKLVQ